MKSWIVRILKESSDWSSGETVTDYDGNIYETIKIGDQVWITQNLIVKHYRNGDAIPEVTDASTWSGLTSGAWCYYNNDSSYM